MDGVVNLDKPPGISSAKAVAQVKRLLPRGVKIGHAGTLDPFATGVLVLLVGKATRQCERMMNEPKRYEARIKLGATTATLDPESEEIVDDNAAAVARVVVVAALRRFVGQIEQRPPVYSALKVGGRAAYQRARQGEEVELKARKVRIDALELLHYQWPMLEARVDCGRGTYIRSLARDIGEALGTKGYLTALKRTRVGDFAIEDAVAMHELRAKGVERFLRKL